MAFADLPNFDELWDYDQPAETERKFRALLTGAASHADYHAELLTQIARAQGLQRRFDDAHRTLDTVQAALTPASAPRTRLRYVLERGRVFNSAGQREKASALFREAFDRAVASQEDFYAVDAAHMLGISEPPEHQLNWNLKALELAERSADPRARKWRGSLYNNIGWNYHDQGDYQTALDLFQRALEWREAQGQARETRIARWCVARTLRSLNRLVEALQTQQALLVECERLGEPDGFVHEELGEILLVLSRAEAARPHFARAHALLSQDPWLSANEPERLKRLQTLSLET